MNRHGVVQDGGMDGWKRLGEEIVRRRVELGYATRDSFSRESRLSLRILSDLENGRRQSYDPSTLARLERALRWVYGSAQAVVDGAMPTALPDDAPAADTEGPGEWEPLSLLIGADLSIADVERILRYIRARLAQQRAQLADEVRQMIAEAGGTVDDDPERLPPRPRGVEQSGDDAPHLYLNRGDDGVPFTHLAN